MLLIIMNCDYSDHCDSIPVNQLKVISYNKHVSACSMIHVVHNSSRSRPDAYNRKPSSHTSQPSAKSHKSYYFSLIYIMYMYRLQVLESRDG